ncbi:molybdate ABC transporter substrate-binding protein [Streptomyces hoynatensis]|uniref:Molybdate ABC transporter substrate-binding protein n=1 Tax=Streptomyces hoynatensis TaxID=1141874 RepID=A0A3A9ZGE3_9ACTN|nr:molybdate ABC transporter substrate-binding protein [Streptomyces hoynatensis]RKN47300.1 molybdate ABC transporter substrate-binding protein [Streptomyces hoynatensis]
MTPSATPATASPAGRAAPARRSRLLLAAAAAAVLALSACGGDSDADENGASGGGEDVTLTVLAAASLTDVFDAAGEVYEEEHPGTTLRFSYGGSQDLVAQIRQGAPADVLATASTETMESLAGQTDAPETFARNALTIVTPPDNPGQVASLADLADPGLRLVLAAEDVPAGHYGREILDRQHLEVSPDSEETDVRSVLSKVQLGEADAGLVYTTDAIAAGEDSVRAVPIPEDQNITAAYPAAALTGSEHHDAAAEFVAWLLSDEAQGLLRDAGFQAP